MKRCAFLSNPILIESHKLPRRPANSPSHLPTQPTMMCHHPTSPGPPSLHQLPNIKRSFRSLHPHVSLTTEIAHPLIVATVAAQTRGAGLARTCMGDRAGTSLILPSTTPLRVGRLARISTRHGGAKMRMAGWAARAMRMTDERCLRIPHHRGDPTRKTEDRQAMTPFLLLERTKASPQAG